MPIAPTPRSTSAMICRGLDTENDFFVFEVVDNVGDAEGEHGGVADEDVVEIPSVETERLERHGKRVYVGEWRGEVDGCEGPGDDGIMDGSGEWSVLGRTLSVGQSVGVGGTNEIRGEGDRKERRPEREGSVDKRVGDDARGGSSVGAKSAVDSENLGRLSDDDDEQGGGARKCRLLDCKPPESPEQVECVGLIVDP